MTRTLSVPSVSHSRSPVAARWVGAPGTCTTASTRLLVRLIRDTVSPSGSATHTPPSPAASTPAVRPTGTAASSRPVATAYRYTVPRVVSSTHTAPAVVT